MARRPKQFNTPHNKAFSLLGAIEPGQNWSAFDVRREQASENAKLFVTTIWNFHSQRDAHGKRTPITPGIARNIADGTFWYRIWQPELQATRKTGIAHRDGIKLALNKQIPIIGVLKDFQTRYCAIDNIFDCDSPRHENSGAIWLQLHPRNGVGCEVREINIQDFTTAQECYQAGTQAFEDAVRESLMRTELDLDSRLKFAPERHGTRPVTSYVYLRNADVVAKRLRLAKGHCERCGSCAPFLRRSDGSPYLEVHHVVSLANDGPDTVENTTALCPNCHRKAHFGPD